MGNTLGNLFLCTDSSLFKKIHVLLYQGILQGVYWGLGTGTGAIVGGFLVHHVGGDITFRAFSLATAAVFSLFVLIQLVLRYAGRDALDYHKIPCEVDKGNLLTDEASEEEGSEDEDSDSYYDTDDRDEE